MNFPTPVQLAVPVEKPHPFHAPQQPTPIQLAIEEPHIRLPRMLPRHKTNTITKQSNDPLATTDQADNTRGIEAHPRSEELLRSI